MYIDLHILCNVASDIVVNPVELACKTCILPASRLCFVPEEDVYGFLVLLLIKAGYFLVLTGGNGLQIFLTAVF